MATAKKARKKPREYNPFIRSFQLTEELYKTIKGLTSLDFPFPLGEPVKKTQTVRWLEYSMAWFIGAALRKEISAGQVDRCLGPGDVLRLWLAYCEARRGTAGYTFSTEDKATREVVSPGGPPERGTRFGAID